MSSMPATTTTASKVGAIPVVVKMASTARECTAAPVEASWAG
jgi:hypothetical protein